MANYLKYQDYISTVEYSTEDRIFHGKVEMINDLVTFEAENSKDLEKNFQEAVEDYLETCKTLGKEPNRTYRGSFNIRLSPKIHRKLHQKAVTLGVSINNFLNTLLERELLTEQRI